MTRKLARTTEKDRQLELPVFAGNVDWFVMLAGEMKRGLIGELGVHNFAVWCALRANTNLDGRIYATIKTLQTQTRMSKPTIIKAIAFLEERQLLQVLRDEKHHRYYIIDHIPYRRIEGEDLNGAIQSINDGQAEGMLAIRYVPKTAARDRADVQNFLKHGAPPAQNPNIQLVKPQVVGQVVMGDQLVVMGDLHLHIPATETAPAITETVPKRDGESPFQSVLERVRRIQEQRLSQAMQDKVLPVKGKPPAGPEED